MPLAPGLQIRKLVRPGGRLTTVVVRHRGPAKPVPERRPDGVSTRKPARPARVPRCETPGPTGFTRPVARALAALGGRVQVLDRDGVALDGRRAALSRVVAEANRCLAAIGRAPIPYPGVGPLEGRR